MNENRLRVFKSLQQPFVAEEIGKLNKQISGLMGLARDFLTAIAPVVNMSPQAMKNHFLSEARNFEPDPKLQELDKHLQQILHESPEKALARNLKNKQDCFPYVIDFHILELLIDRMEKEGF